MTAESAALRFTALEGVGEVRPGDDLVGILLQALETNGQRLTDGDAVVFCQKIVSKSENRYVELSTVDPGPRALELAGICGKDPRLVELVLRESTEVLRCVSNLLIVRHRLGFVVANAAIDQSNIPGDGERALLLPEHPDASAAKLREAILQRTGRRVAVLVSDSFGRAWRLGVTGVCIGCSGLTALIDRRGDHDRFGRQLQVTQIAAGDAIAAAAALVMGEADEGRPIVVVSGLPEACLAQDRPARHLLRAVDEDLFR